MKVVSEQLGHSSLAITADTYTSVLPAVAHAAADAVAGIVPRTVPARQELTVEAAGGPLANGQDAAALAGRYQSGPKTDPGRPPGRVNAQVRDGAPSRTRIPNPLSCPRAAAGVETRCRYARKGCHRVSQAVAPLRWTGMARMVGVGSVAEVTLRGKAEPSCQR